MIAIFRSSLSPNKQWLCSKAVDSNRVNLSCSRMDHTLISSLVSNINSSRFRITTFLDFDQILQTPDGRQMIQQVSAQPPPPQRQQIILPPGAQVIAQAMPGQQVIVNAGNQQITLTEGAQLIRLATGQFQIIQPAPVQYAINQNQIILVSKPNRPTPVSIPLFLRL